MKVLILSIGRKIMLKEPKTPEDIDKAISYFTEAIAAASSSITSSDKGAAKFHAARGHA